jgi:DNA-binding LytR/AlgR family response regulator
MTLHRKPIATRETNVDHEHHRKLIYGAAVDYVLKPVQPDRLEKTCARLQTALRQIQASAGNTITMVPITDVLYFEAADKYVRVVTAERGHLIKISLRELQLQLDPALLAGSSQHACALR